MSSSNLSIRRAITRMTSEEKEKGKFYVDRASRIKAVVMAPATFEVSISSVNVTTLSSSLIGDGGDGLLRTKT